MTTDRQHFMKLSPFGSLSLSRYAPVIVLTAFAVLARPVLAQDDSPAATSTMSLFFASLAVVAVVCLIVGWENPKRFKFAFGDKATIPFVRGGFGAAILVFGFLGQSLDPGRSADQIAANERRVAQSEARLQDARQREQDAKERERKAQQSEREARKKERVAANRQRQAQKEAQRAQSQAEKIEEQNVRAEKARKQRESDSQEAGESPEHEPSAKSGKKTAGLLDSLVKSQQVQSYAETDGVTLTLRNRDDFAWTDVKVNINPTFGYLGGYEYTVKQMRSGGEIIVPLREFATPQGERLKPFETKLLTFALRCKTPDGTIGVFRGNWPSAMD